MCKTLFFSRFKEAAPNIYCCKPRRPPLCWVKKKINV